MGGSPHPPQDAMSPCSQRWVHRPVDSDMKETDAWGDILSVVLNMDPGMDSGLNVHPREREK